MRARNTSALAGRVDRKKGILNGPRWTVGLMRSLVRWLSAGAAALGVLGSGCAVKTVPGDVADLGLPIGASLTASSLGEDGRLWFAFMGTEAGPGVGSIGVLGSPTTIGLSPVAYGQSVNDIAVTADRHVWTALACYPTNVRCGEGGYASFPADDLSHFRARRIGNGNTFPDGVSLDRDGSLWISDAQANDVVHVLRNGTQRVFAIPDKKFAPFGLLAMKDGVYVVGQEPGKICAFDRRGTLRWIALPDKTSHATNLAAGEDGRVWLAELDANKVLSVGPDDRLRVYPIPTADSKPAAVAVDAQGVIWFTESDTDKIGWIGADGDVRDAYLPYGLSTPVFVFAGPSDTLYVVGAQDHWLGMYRTFVVARIPAGSVR